MNETLLKAGLEALALPSDGPLATRLCCYGSEIETWNPAYGLVGAEGDELVIKHLLDSLAPLETVKKLLASIAADRDAAGRRTSPELHLADLGTGAGLPGIPLALVLPEVRVALIDRMTKRIRFLEAMRDSLPLPNVDIVEDQVERARGRYDLVTFRAFHPFERKLFKKVFSLCENDGFVVAYKGREDKARAELAGIEGLFSSAEIVPVKVPFLDDERCLVVLRPAAR